MEQKPDPKPKGTFKHLQMYLITPTNRIEIYLMIVCLFSDLIKAWCRHVHFIKFTLCFIPEISLIVYLVMEKLISLKFLLGDL